MPSSSSRFVIFSAVVVLYGASLPKGAQSASIWDLINSIGSKRKDCTYTHWGTWEGCHTRMTKVWHKRTRSMSQPKNGGRACPRNPKLEDWQTCSDLEAMADKFVGSLHARASEGEMSKGSAYYRVPTAYPDDNETDSLLDCREIKDKNGKLLVSGGRCGNIRKRRSSFDPLFDYEFPDPIIDVDPFADGEGDPDRHWDLLLLLDESGSVGKDNFHNVIIHLAKAIVKSLCGSKIVKHDRTRVSVASFDRHNHAHIYLWNENMNDPGGILDKMDTIKYNSTSQGSTCLGSALEFAQLHMFRKNRGARLDATSEEQIILITDGCANCATHSLSRIASNLYDAKMAILTIFIGNSRHCEETLQNLESRNEGKCWHMFSPKNWDDAKTFADHIWKKGCDDNVVANLAKSCY